MTTLKNISLVLITLFACITTACKDETSDPLVLDSDVNITSFAVNGAEGVVDNEAGTITVFVPAGTNLAAVSPVITLPANATIAPASGVAQNFTYSATTPIEYRVFNGNLYTTYKVTVKEIKAEITSFRIGGRTGIVNQSEKTVLIYLPESTDVTALSPVIAYTEGAAISPDQGSYVDFTSPVTYTLTYQGERFTYTVTVMLGDEPILPLVLYNGEDVMRQWAQLGGGPVDSSTPNPKTGGINTTDFCASFERNASTGEGWHGGALWNENKVNVDPAEYSRFSLMVLKQVAGDVQLEIQADGETDKAWLRAWYSEEHLGQWQELIFYIPADRTAIISNILVMPHEHANGQPVAFPTQRMYWDELKALPKE
ncbi:hypothetical protein [Sphingobacterium daejeonense]|uniref:hypothetical protein n=1 Tax=Sphingobacterium daejeonense TaxID=371142 RepID=UPI0010C331A1|nr:hypothetical protein [Sphingobacterium daejeonense]VTP86710.1 Putative glycoside hydrolase [Sphingobacterium daejeonense]